MSRSRIPAICANPECRAVYLVGLPLSGEFYSIDNRAGPCPRCGSLGQVLDGIYSSINGDLQLLELFDTVRNMALRPSELRTILAVLKHAQAHELSAQATANAVRSRVSNAEPIAEAIESRRSENIRWMIMFIIGLLATIGAYTGPVRDWDIPDLHGSQQVAPVTVTEDVPDPRAAPTPGEEEDSGTPEPNDDCHVK